MRGRRVGRRSGRPSGFEHLVLNCSTSIQPTRKVKPHWKYDDRIIEYIKQGKRIFESLNKIF